jgi:hypothetical protein
MSTSDEANGHVTDTAEKLFERLGTIRDVPGDVGGYTPTNGDGPTGRFGRSPEDASEPPPQEVPRHPGDPPGAMIDSAREICDPEAIREYAVRLGQALFGLSPAIVEEAVDRLFGRLHDVRAGAEVMQGQRQAGEQLLISATTEEAVSQILAEALAAELKADRLEAQELPEAQDELEQAYAGLKEAEHALDLRQAEYDSARVDAHAKAESDQEAAPRNEPNPRPNLFGLLDFFAAQAKRVIPAEILVFVLLLAAPVAQVTGVSLQYGALLAAGMSVAVLGASGLAGVALAAMRLPGWLVGVVLIGLYGLIMLKFVPGLDALRAFDPVGVETLTAATLAACLVAATTGYALAVRRDRDAEAEEGRDGDGALLAASPAYVALEARDRSQRRVGELAAAAATARKARDVVRDRIEELRHSAARGPIAVMERLQEGTAAEARLATIRAMTATAVGQERAAAQWAAEMAILAHLKIRAEGLPPVDALVGDRSRFSPSASSGPVARARTGLERAALVVFAAGSFGFVVAGPVAPALGSGTAAVLLLVRRRPLPRLWRRARVEADAEAQPEAAPIGSPASVDSRTWRRHPDRTVPRYGDGGAGVGERQP